MEEGCALDPPNPLKAAIEREENQTCLSSSEREQGRPKVNLGFKLFLAWARKIFSYAKTLVTRHIW